MNLTRGIALLPVAIALGLTAQAQQSEIDPTAKPVQARPSVQAPAKSASGAAQEIDVTAVTGPVQVRAAAPAVAGPAATTSGQTAEVDPAATPGTPGSTKAFGYAWNNGPFITDLGAGFGGADASVLQTGFTTFGYGNQGGTINNRIADDFVVDAGEMVALDGIVWRFYQTGGSTAGTITGLNVNIWNDDPLNLGTALQNGPANSFASQVWSGAYRVTSTTLLTNNRPIIDVHADMTWTNPLGAGTYWVDVTGTGSLASGPWAPPTTPAGANDNGRQFIGSSGTWFAVVDGLALLPQDFPFELSGSRYADGYCYNNGPFITDPGAGFNGADASVLETGFNTIGYGTQGGTINNRIADDFPVPAGKSMAPTALVWRFYQTGGSTAGTLTGMNVNIWDDDPLNLGAPIQSGPANSFTSQVWSGAYRVTSTTLLANNRPVIDTTSDMTWATALESGTYWVDVTATGSLASGPWSPPKTPTAATDNGRQFIGSTLTWGVAQDSGALVPQDFPFDICGDLQFSGCGWDNGPFITDVGAGFNGADASVLQTGFTTFGYGTQGGTINNRIADDFDVPAGDAWILSGVEWKFYQTGGSTAGTITGLNVNIWDDSPLNLGVPAQTGPANSFASQVWTGAYRVSSTTLTANNRPIIAATSDMAWAAPLLGGTYWVDVSGTGSLASGPWSPPTTPAGAGDNALQFIGSSGTWGAVIDGLALLPQDFPFVVTAGCDNGPVVYCTSKLTSCNTTPSIGAAAGVTSQSASASGTFDVTCGPVPAGNFGLLIYSTAGQMPPLVNQFGTICVNMSVGFNRITPPGKGIGPACDALYTFDFGDFLATQVVDPNLSPATLALTGGQVVDMQCWYRDPPNVGAANISNAMRFIVLP